MTSTFFGLNIALRGLMAQRQAMDVTAHNISNAATEGFTRQEAVMKAAPPFSVPCISREVQAGQMGTGVEVDAIRRIRDQFLDYEIREQTSALGRWETKRDYLQQIESILNEPSDSGIADAFSKMWAAWYDLSNDPTSYVARAAVIQTGNVLADSIRRAALQLDSMRQGADHEISTILSDTNSLLTEIDELNRQIVKVEVSGDDANDLRDRRDYLLDKLARTAQVGYQEQSDGSVTVWLGPPRSGTPPPGPPDLILVEMATGKLASLSWDSTTGQLSSSLGGDVTTSILNGELKALLDLRNGDLNPSAADGIAGRLEELADSLMREINGIVNPTGTAEDFFVSTVGHPSNAQGIVVNPAVAADPMLIPAGAAGEPGDGSIALQVAQLLDKKVTVGGGEMTLEAWYQQIISRLGISAAESKALATNQSLLVTQLTTNRESLSGVSLDEEAANMIRFQRAYEASARMITVMDEMLDKIVNDMGLAGR